MISDVSLANISIFGNICTYKILCMLLITQESGDIFGDIFEIFDGGKVHNHIRTKAKIKTCF